VAYARSAAGTVSTLVVRVRIRKFAGPCGKLRPALFSLRVRPASPANAKQVPLNPFEKKGLLMKLYYAPGACSMAPHVVLREAGYKFDLEKVDIPNKKTAGGEDYWKINPKGYVPALKLDDGQVLTEVQVICQYLADHKADSGLAPEAGTMERYRLMEMLNFTASEIHKQIGALFNPKMTPEMKEVQLAYVERRLNTLEKLLEGKQYASGGKFSIADAYLFTILNWTGLHKIDLAKWPNIKAFQARIAARPKVQETMKAEGLVK
jgi:glutathione S-transferase